MNLNVGFQRIIRPVSMMRRCWPSVKATVPSRYTVKTTQVRFSLCRHLCDHRSPDAVELVTSEEQEEDCQTNVESAEDETAPRSLPLPSKELLDSMNDHQMEHYNLILHRYENDWRINKDNLKIPTVMTDSNWKKVLGVGARRTLEVLSWIHDKEIKKKLKKQLKQLREPKEQNNDLIIHQCSVPTSRVRKTFNILRTYQAVEYGPELVFDLGFTPGAAHASHIFKEEIRIRRQLTNVIHENYKKRLPFHLVFCNVDEKSRSMLEEVASDVPVTITERSYLDMFPKQELVYLSPDSKTELATYNHNHVYIVGCITDLETKPFTKEKAQKQGIKHASFPIRSYLGNLSSCLLTLNQVSDVLNDLRDTGSWRTALKHVPERFQKPQDYRSKLKQKTSKMF